MKKIILVMLLVLLGIPAQAVKAKYCKILFDGKVGNATQSIRVNMMSEHMRSKPGEDIDLLLSHGLMFDYRGSPTIIICCRPETADYGGVDWMDITMRVLVDKKVIAQKSSRGHRAMCLAVTLP